MKVLRPGHRYELDNFESDKIPIQIIQFIEKEQDPHGPTGQLVTINNGTTNEDVLRVLIDRMQKPAGEITVSGERDRYYEAGRVSDVAGKANGGPESTRSRR